MINNFKIYHAGDQTITIQLGDAIDGETHHKVMSLFKYVQQHRFNGLLDVIPAYTSVTVVYDVTVVRQSVVNGQPAAQWVNQYLQLCLGRMSEQTAPNKRQISIPVCYHMSLAPDLEYIATRHKLTTDQVVHLHTATTYKVYMLGFLPGFPYMAAVDEQIATPRKAEPRKLVPAGSVGITGNQTGIYPFASPGGWQLIGQTPLQIFDAQKEEPALLQPGDEVQFYAISLTDFNRQKQI